MTLYSFQGYMSDKMSLKWRCHRKPGPSSLLVLILGIEDKCSCEKQRDSGRVTNVDTTKQRSSSIGPLYLYHRCLAKLMSDIMPRRAGWLRVNAYRMIPLSCFLRRDW